jgi:alkanesulfonate monooxygenase SsuD/methylene tetrahydromethanopterin reductase-like flavin-dependent oxidoreductase (luciferase family)
VIGAPGAECWTALTALTARPERLTAIPLVLASPYRQPAVVAKMAATFREAFGDRLILGLGSGGSPADAEAHGVGWRTTGEMVAQMEEAIQVMRLLWSGGGSFSGRWFRLREAPPMATDSGPPVLVGGHGRRHLLPAAARSADLCNVGFDLSLAEWESVRRLFRDHALKAGRDPTEIGLTHNATVIIARDDREVEARVETWARERRLDPETARKRLRHALVGTPDQTAERLHALRSAGVGWTFLLFHDLADGDSLRVFAEGVLPAFR